MLDGCQVHAENTGAFRNTDDPLRRGKGRGLDAADLDALDRRPGLRHRRADDVDRNADRPLVGAGRVEEDVLRVDRHPGPLAVDDRREGEDVVVVVHDQREEREVLHDLRVVPALRVLFEDLVHRHLLFEIERDEPPAAARGDVVERRFHRVHVMDADRNLGPAPADRPVERLLQGHDALDRLVIKSDTADDCCSEHGADLLKGGVDREFDSRRLDRVDRQAGLDPEVAPHRACNTLGAEEVGPVGEELHVCVVFLGPLHIRTDKGNFLEDRLPVGTGEPFEILVGERDDCHFRSLPSSGAARASRAGTRRRSCAGGGGP